MYCLAIDTSSKFLCVALIKDDDILGKYNKAHERQHSVLLLSKIEEVMKSCRMSVRDIDCLAVDIGPGSFTGLRIGIAAAKGLSLALDKPIIGISSLDLIAAGQKDNEGIICPVIDAKRQQVYSAIYNRSRGQVKRKGKYFLGPIELLLEKIKGQAVFCGDALELYQENIKAHKDIQPVMAKRKKWYVSADAFASLCHAMYRKKEFKDAGKISPLYLYQNTCTVRKKAINEKNDKK